MLEDIRIVDYDTGVISEKNPVTDEYVEWREKFLTAIFEGGCNEAEKTKNKLDGRVEYKP